MALLSMFILASNPNDSILSFLPMIMIFAVIYFFFIRPQAKKQKDQDRFVKEIEKGIEVVTTSGIIGKISKIEENIVTLQLDQKTFIRVLSSSISKEMTDSYNK